jgi:hypothetical protein
MGYIIGKADTEIAERLATKYQGSAAFGRDDAFQACIEGLLKAGVNAPEGVKVKAMKDEMHRQSVEASYLMRVPWSTWKKMPETPAHVRYTGLDTETLVMFESPSTAISDPRIELIEEAMALRSAWDQLDDTEKGHVEWALTQYRLGKRPGGKRFSSFKKVVSKLREAVVCST